MSYQRKESILDLEKYFDQRLVVKFNGGREVSGKLKGYDALVNIVLDDAIEYIETSDGNTVTREFGLMVCKGSSVMVVHPEAGTEEIANPWATE